MLRSWRFEASNDGKKWTTLKTHNRDMSLGNERGTAFAWDLDPVSEPYSFFRVYMVRCFVMLWLVSSVHSSFFLV